MPGNSVPYPYVQADGENLLNCCIGFALISGLAVCAVIAAIIGMIFL